MADLTREAADQIASRIVKRITEALGQRLEPLATTRGVGAATVPRVYSATTAVLAALAGGAAGGVGVKAQLSGRWITSLLAGADAGAVVEVAFGDDQGDPASPTATSASPVTTQSWFPLAPGAKVSAPGGVLFSVFRVRLAAGTLTTGTRRFLLAADVEPGGQSAEEVGRFANLTPSGSYTTSVQILDGAGTEVPVQGATVSLGASATMGVAGHVAGSGAAVLATVEVDATGRQNVNPIVGQAGVQGAAGVINALTQRMTVATDDVVSTALVSLATIVTAARGAVNPIVGQAGVAAGVGATGVTVQRVVPVTIATGAATTVTTAGGASTQAVAANASRASCVLRNDTTTAGATMSWAVGAAAVSGTGPSLAPGESVTIRAVGAVNVIRDTATNVVAGAYDESY